MGGGLLRGEVLVSFGTLWTGADEPGTRIVFQFASELQFRLPVKGFLSCGCSVLQEACANGHWVNVALYLVTSLYSTTI